MALSRDAVRLRDQYALHVQVGLILALTLLIVAFRMDLRPGAGTTVQMQAQEAVDITEIRQTAQEEPPPAPPTPPVPQEVPNDRVIEEDTPTFDASLDLSERLDPGGPPPPPNNDPAAEEGKEQEIFVVVEQYPDCGGMAALHDHLEYPSFAQKAGIEGRVIVQFVVDETGAISNASVAHGGHTLLNEAALDAARALECTPGMQRGRPVKVQMTIPVRFRLQD